MFFKLLFYGRDYPQGYDFFRSRLRAAFRKNLTETEPAQIEQLLKRGEFVLAEIDALYKLKKYRHLKRVYYDEAAEAQKLAAHIEKRLE